MQDHLAARIAENLDRIRQRMATEAASCGRRDEEITLVAVTKYVGLPEVKALLDQGCRVLGESRPQALWEKASAEDLGEVEWHLVGHLQRNKVRRTLPIVSLIHSVDSPRLIQTVDREAQLLSRRVPILLEVNVSSDATKHGLAADDLRRLLPDIGQCQNVQVCGLMTMAAREGGQQVAQRNFAQLRELRDSLRDETPPGTSLDVLSMGMSGDLEAAIREGSTMVRVGSALFEGLGQ